MGNNTVINIISLFSKSNDEIMIIKILLPQISGIKREAGFSGGAAKWTRFLSLLMLADVVAAPQSDRFVLSFLCMRHNKTQQAGQEVTRRNRRKSDKSTKIKAIVIAALPYPV